MLYSQLQKLQHYRWVPLCSAVTVITQHVPDMVVVQFVKGSYSLVLQEIWQISWYTCLFILRPLSFCVVLVFYFLCHSCVKWISWPFGQTWTQCDVASANPLIAGQHWTVSYRKVQWLQLVQMGPLLYSAGIVCLAGLYSHQLLTLCHSHYSTTQSCQSSTNPAMDYYFFYLDTHSCVIKR